MSPWTLRKLKINFAKGLFLLKRGCFDALIMTMRICILGLEVDPEQVLRQRDRAAKGLRRLLGQVGPGELPRRVMN